LANAGSLGEGASGFITLPSLSKSKYLGIAFMLYCLEKEVLAASISKKLFQGTGVKIATNEQVFAMVGIRIPSAQI
jgi:hypothetical protein